MWPLKRINYKSVFKYSKIENDLLIAINITTFSKGHDCLTFTSRVKKLKKEVRPSKEQLELVKICKRWNGHHQRFDKSGRVSKEQLPIDIIDKIKKIINEE